MKHYKTKGLYDFESDVWDFYSIEEISSHTNDSPNWKSCVKDAKQILGKKCHKNEIRYLVEGKPIYKLYTIVGLEDNKAWGDYYWIIRPIGETSDKYDSCELCNNIEFYKNIISYKRKKKK